MHFIYLFISRINYSFIYLFKNVYHLIIFVLSYNIIKIKNSHINKYYYAYYNLSEEIISLMYRVKCLILLTHISNYEHYPKQLRF
jgi:hypothetical protein